MSGGARARILGGLVVASVLAAACEQTFEALQPADDLYYSIHALLDVAADTQWVRVMPIRQTVHTSAEPVDAVVTLQKVDGGPMIVLRDSAFTYRRDLGGELIAHNFWTDEPLEPGVTYRFTATRSDGAAAVALVPMPRDFATVVVGYHLRREGNPPMYGTPWSSDYVRLPEEVDHPAMVRVLHHVPLPCQAGYPTAAVYQPMAGAPGSRPPVGSAGRINITNFYDRTDSLRWFFPVVPCNRQVHRWEIAITASGVPWPFSSLHSLALIAHPDFASNVSHAIGYIGGVLTRTVPYEPCLLAFPVSEYCELTYGPTSAELRGTVRDLSCGGPLDRASVVLRRLDSTLYRPTFTDPDGSFSIGALEARDYRLEVNAPVPGFEPYEEVLRFEAGQLSTVEVGLRRTTASCG